LTFHLAGIPPAISQSWAVGIASSIYRFGLKIDTGTGARIGSSRGKH
jgi:hypothetical protein